MKFYIATGHDNRQAHNRLRDLLTAAGWTISRDWTLKGFDHELNPSEARGIAVEDTAGVQAADVVFVLDPGGPGTHVELGVAIASGKKVIVASEHRDDAQLIRDHDIFYFYPEIRRFRGTLETLAGAAITGARLWTAVRSPRSS